MNKHFSKSPDLELGAIYCAKVTSIEENGIYVEIPKQTKPCFVHNAYLNLISERFNKDSAVDSPYNIGKFIFVKFLGMEPCYGRVVLSERAVYSPGSNRIIKGIFSTKMKVKE